MDFDFDKIYQVVWTRSDAEILLGYIDILVDSLYGLDGKSFESVARKIPEEKIALTLLAEIRKVPEDERKIYLRKLKDAVKDRETMKLSVAVDLSREAIEEIVSAVRTKLKEVVVDFEVEPEIIGGAKVSWRGKFWDKTLYDKI